MILVILFFSISMTVTARLFVSAASRADQSRDLTAAMVQAQNLAEQVRGIPSPDELPAMLSTVSGGAGSDGTYRLKYDKNWNHTEKNPSFLVEVTMEKTSSGPGTLVEADIEVRRSQPGSTASLMSLHPAKYFSRPSQP